MKLGKKVYRNKLNGELYRELIAGDMPCGITLNKENIKNPSDVRMCSLSEIAIHLEEVEYSSMRA